MEEPRNEDSWNKKKIFIAVSLLALLVAGGYLFKTRILGTESSSSQEQKSVKGVAIKDKNKEKEDFSINIKESVKEKINSLKQEVSGLDILEIASSSPQVQKILRDIKSLEQYPINQAQEICKKICGL